MRGGVKKAPAPGEDGGADGDVEEEGGKGEGVGMGIARKRARTGGKGKAAAGGKGAAGSGISDGAGGGTRPDPVDDSAPARKLFPDLALLGASVAQGVIVGVRFLCGGFVACALRYCMLAGCLHTCGWLPCCCTWLKSQLLVAGDFKHWLGVKGPQGGDAVLRVAHHPLCAKPGRPCWTSLAAHAPSSIPASWPPACVYIYHHKSMPT